MVKKMSQNVQKKILFFILILIPILKIIKIKKNFN